MWNIAELLGIILIQRRYNLYIQIRDELTQKLEALEQEVEGHRQETAEQKQRYEQVQARHALEMDEIRKAGHDALAIIVEEYKVLFSIGGQTWKIKNKKTKNSRMPLYSLLFLC